MEPSPTVLIPPRVEQVLKSVIFNDLTHHGRPNWDRPHTEAVVHWMKTLWHHLPNTVPTAPSSPQNSKPHHLKLNSKVLLTAAYAHDWGYAGLFTTTDRNPRSLANALLNKKLHMQRGAEKIERLLYQQLSSDFTEAEKLRVVHLVSVHDLVKKLTAEDELFLMECDTLGMIDNQRAPSTFSPQDHAAFLARSIYDLRLPRFVHQAAKQAAEQLLEKSAE